MNYTSPNILIFISFEEKAGSQAESERGYF